MCMHYTYALQPVAVMTAHSGHFSVQAACLHQAGVMGSPGSCPGCEMVVWLLAPSEGRWGGDRKRSAAHLTCRHYRLSSRVNVLWLGTLIGIFLSWHLEGSEIINFTGFPQPFLTAPCLRCSLGDSLVLCSFIRNRRMGDPGWGMPEASASLEPPDRYC